MEKPQERPQEESQEHLTVQELLDEKIAASPFTLLDISKKAGFESHAMLSMIRNGKAKLAVPKVRRLARVLELDPDNLLRMVLQERMPEVWDAIEPMIENSFQTKNELEIMKIIREEAHGMDVFPATRAQEKALRKQVQEWLKDHISPSKGH